jgi:hypothetical protein
MIARCILAAMIACVALSSTALAQKPKKSKSPPQYVWSFYGHGDWAGDDIDYKPPQTGGLWPYLNRCDSKKWVAVCWDENTHYGATCTYKENKVLLRPADGPEPGRIYQCRERPK